MGPVVQGALPQSTSQTHLLRFSASEQSYIGCKALVALQKAGFRASHSPTAADEKPKQIRGGILHLEL